MSTLNNAPDPNRRILAGPVLAFGGIVFPLLFAVSFVFDATTMVGTIPRPGSTATEVADFYAANTGVFAYLRAGVRLVAAMALAAFALHLAVVPRRESTANSPVRLFDSAATRCVVAAVGVLSAVALAVSPVLSVIANSLVGSVDPEALVVMRETNYLVGGEVHLAVLGAYAGLLTIAIWNRLSWLMRGIGLLTMVIGLAVPLNGYLNPPSRMISWAWIVMLTVIVLRGSWKSRADGAG